jgi:hypothetical protein
VGGDVFAFAEEGEQNKGGDDQELDDDGDKEGAVLVATHVRFLSGIALDKASAEKTETFFGNGSSRHHTPPKSARELAGSCGASLLGCHQETSAALAGM